MNNEAKKSYDTSGGPIAWMVNNRVTANLLMIFLLVGGFFFLLKTKQEVYPEYSLDIIQVTVPYPGASPEEVEKGIVIAVEDKVRGAEGVKKVSSSSVEGGGIVTIEMSSGVNAEKLLQEIKNSIDQIHTLPKDSGRPLVSLVELKRHVISLILYGDLDQRTLRDFGEFIKEELLDIDGITMAELSCVPNPIIAVEVPRNKLRSHDISLDQIAKKIKETISDIPGGQVNAKLGEVLLRTQENRQYASEFEDIPVITHPDGTRVHLGEIASVQEAFEGSDNKAVYNGKPAVRIDIYRVGEQGPLDISSKVKNYIKEKNLQLPEGVKMVSWEDKSEVFSERIHLLINNAITGFILVLITLGLFLEPRLAFWITMGIPISIIGSFLIIPFLGVSINMVSLFAFIVTLGIIVDDSIVVGENIYLKRQQGMSILEAAVEGAREISMPVIFAVLTNMVAFVPLLFIPGSTGKIFFQIPAITLTVFFISLIECLFILPAHLSYDNEDSKFWKILRIPSLYFNNLMDRFVNSTFVKYMDLAVRFRYLTLCSAIALLIITGGFIAGGYLKFSYFPRVVGETVTVQAELPFGSPSDQANALQDKLMDSAQFVIKELGGSVAKGVYGQIGKKITSRGNSSVSRGGVHLVGVQILLYPPDVIGINAQEFANKWRDKFGDVPGLQSIIFTAASVSAGGSPIDIELSHKSSKILESAAKELADSLKHYKGVEDIDDGILVGKPQMTFKLKPETRNLGISVQDLASQVRNAFYGTEALRQQRGRDEIKVMVRLPKAERKTLHTAEELVVRSPSGGEIALGEAVEVTQGRSYTEIKRTNGKRVLNVTADVNEKFANPNKVLADVVKNKLGDLTEKYPGLSYSIEGQKRAQNESLKSMKIGFIISMFAIFCLLAIPFKSYLQPLIVMLSIPFGFIGAVFGHILLGYEMSIVSLFGIIALSGVVINGSLVLLVTANRNRENGLSAVQSIRQAGTTRFRPIILTSVTTFFGLAPMIFEKSVQARFLIPMAISLGFGVLFATLIILFLTPAVYMIAEDLSPGARSKGEEI